MVGSPGAGRKDAPTSRLLVWWWLAQRRPLPHTGHRRDKRLWVTSTRLQTSNHRAHLHLQPARSFHTLYPASLTATVNVFPCFESTKALCVGFLPVEASPGYLLVILPYSFPLTTYGLLWHLTYLFLKTSLLTWWFPIYLIVCVLVAQLCPTLYHPMDCSQQAPLSMGFSRQEYQSG